MARLKPTGSPTESARERARARRCYHPEDEYNPNHSGAVRGFDTDSLLSSIEQERSKTHGSGETERTGPAFVLRADDEGREVGVLRLPGAKKRGGQAGRRADAEGTRRVFGLVGHGEEQREEEVLAQRHVTFNDDNRLESPESSRLRVADPPDRGIFAGEDGEDHEYDEEEFEDDNEYSPTDYDYVVQQPEDSGPRTPSIGSSSSSTGQRSEAHDPSDRRSTLGAGRYSPHRPFTAMLGRWPSSSRSPSAQTPLDRSYRLPGHYPNSSPAPLSTVSHFSARRAAPGPVGRAGGRGYSPTDASWQQRTGRDPSPYSTHLPRSSLPALFDRNTEGNKFPARQSKRGRHSPRLVQRSPNHWSISEGGSPGRASSSSGGPSTPRPSQPLRQRTCRPVVGAWPSASSRGNSLSARLGSESLVRTAERRARRPPCRERWSTSS